MEKEPVLENCKICGSKNDFFSSATILKKYDINYFRCFVCGFVQTQEPYWLDEAYSTAIADSDVGNISRNIQNRDIVKNVLDFCFSEFFKQKTKPVFMDYAGGYGMFVRMMRDLGYDFYWYDKYCKGIFVAKHTIADMQKKYSLVTAFEVMEHIYNPLFEIDKIFQYSDNLIFSTQLLPKILPKPNEWWYYALSSGQHISFYTKKSLEIIAEKFGKKYVGNESLHIFLDKKRCDWKIKLINGKHGIKIAKIVNKVNRLFSPAFYRKESFLNFDYEKITGEQL
jgi:hypothetical protein